MFLKYYKHLFRFTLSIDDEEAMAQCSLGRDIVGTHLWKKVEVVQDIPLPTYSYLPWRAVSITIPKGSQFEICKDSRDGQEHRAILKIEGDTEDTWTEIYVDGYEELEQILNLSLTEEVINKQHSW